MNADLPGRKPRATLQAILRFQCGNELFYIIVSFSLFSLLDFYRILCLILT